MVFNSINFAIFFPLVFILFWILRGSYRWQNFLLLIANYLFYGWFNWRFLLIIFSISVINLIASGIMDNATKPHERKLALWTACLFTGGMLAIMKYYNFFVSSIADVVHLFGVQWHVENVKWLMPIGLSYYVFTSIGYVIDVYRKKINAAEDVIGYMAYVSFFPHILSGPIAQATHLLPQFLRKRDINYKRIEDGVMQFTWGMFKKIVIADALVKNVAYIFKTYEDQTGSVLLIGAILYSFQVYADFSGYSDMACGLARILGFDIIQNFNLPFFSRNIGEFWRRWHISLSKWLTDYVYVPLGGKSDKTAIYIRNILITFTFSGLWHGANWTYVVWGLLNGLYFIPAILRGGFKKYENPIAHNRWLPSFKEFGQMLFVFSLVTFSRIIFRSPNITAAFAYMKGMFSASLFTIPNFGAMSLLWILGLVVFEWLNRHKRYALEPVESQPLWVRYPAFATAAILIGMAINIQPTSEYIYFKF
jgi:D-alanyl-lipoteichoic acid acyltransferase DltB (MBOAT superfamily)